MMEELAFMILVQTDALKGEIPGPHCMIPSEVLRQTCLGDSV